MYVWYRMIWCVRHITLTCNTAALVPRAVCSSRRSTVQKWKKYCVPSRPVVKIKMYRPCRRKEKVTSLPVVEEIIYRPVPSWKIICTVPSRRDNFYLPSRRVVTFFTYRSVPSWNKKGHCIVPSRPVEKFHTHRPVPSHLGNYIFIFLPSRPVPSWVFFPAKHVNAVPSRPVSNITSHELPWKL